MRLPAVVNVEGAKMSNRVFGRLAAVITTVVCVGGWPGSARAQSTEVSLTGASHAFGVVAAGEQTAAREIAVDTATSLRIVVASPGPLAVEIALPDGRRITQANAAAAGIRMMEMFLGDTPVQISSPTFRYGAQTVAEFHDPAPGTYSVRVTSATPASERIPFVVSAYPESNIRLGVSVPESETLAGTPIAVTATLVDGGVPIPQARVVASIARGRVEGGNSPAAVSTVPLLDDGRSPDFSGADGVYTGLVTASTTPGAYVASVRAEGTSASGHDFRRDSTAEFRVSSRTSRLVGLVHAAGVDANGNGRFERLAVTIEVEVGAAGSYNLSLLLRAANGTSVASNRIGALAEGPQVVDVLFPADYLLSLGADAPYTIASARLDEMTPTERILRDRSTTLGVLSGFRIAQFEGFVARPGDVNQDGVVDCADLSLVRAAYGTRTGQTRYDARADVNSDGVINLVDLTTVSRALPAGTRCG